MREIGIRELKTSLSAVLHEVDEGEQIRVTRHGRAIADIMPAGSRRRDESLRALVAEGKLTPASRARPRRPARPLDAGRSASEVVLAERDAER
jgi:prevent-host-death family protein